MISETPKLSIFQLRHRQGQRVMRPAVSLRGGSKNGPGRRRKSSLTLSSFVYSVQRSKTFLVGHRHVKIIGSSNLSVQYQ